MSTTDIDSSSIQEFIDSLLDDIHNVEGLMTSLDVILGKNDNRLYNLENIMHQTLRDGRLSDIQKKLVFSLFSKFADIDETATALSVNKILPDIEHPIVIYNGSQSYEQTITGLTNKKYEINLNSYFVSQYYEKLVFMVDNSILQNTYRHNLYRPEMEDNIIENMIIREYDLINENNQPYKRYLNIIDSSNIIFVPDYRGQTYDITIYAFDYSKTYEIVKDINSKYKSRGFTFRIIEDELPSIETINTTLSFDLTSLEPIRINLEENIELPYDYISLKIDYEEENPILLNYSYRTRFITQSDDTSNIELDVSIESNITTNYYYELVIVPNLRGINGEDLEYQVIVDITDSVYGLTEEFIVTVSEPPPLKRNIDDDPYYILSNNEVNINLEGMFSSESCNLIIYTPNSDEIPFTFENNIVNVKGDYRGIYENGNAKNIINQIEVFAEDCNFSFQKVKFYINIEELPPPPPIYIGNDIYMNDITINTITCNIDGYFEPGIENNELSYNIYGIYNQNLFELDNSNIIITPILKERQQTSILNINAIDRKYNVESTVVNTNNKLKVTVVEKASIKIINTISNKVSNTKDPIEIIITDYYQSPINASLSYSFHVNKVLRNDKITDLNAFDEQSDRLIITPDYRNTTYTVTLYGYDPNYIQYQTSYGILFNITEGLAPKPLLGSEKEINFELTNQLQEIDINGKFTSANLLRYEFVNNTRTWVEFDNINTTIVKITPNLRGTSYSIYVKAIDTLYEVESEQTYKINIIEKQPIEIQYNILDLLDKEKEEIVIDLNNYFRNTINDTITYELGEANTNDYLITNVRQTYDEPRLDPIILNNNELTIYTDYRDREYNIKIIAYYDVDEYKEQTVSQQFKVHEKQIKEINPIDDNIINISSFNEKSKEITLGNYFNENYIDLSYKITQIDNNNIEVSEINIYYSGNKLYYDQEFTREVTTHLIVGIKYKIIGSIPSTFGVRRQNTKINLLDKSDNSFEVNTKNKNYEYGLDVDRNDATIFSVMNCNSDSKKRIYLWYQDKTLYFANELKKPTRHEFTLGFYNIQYHILNENEKRIRVKKASNDYTISESKETNLQYFEFNNSVGTAKFKYTDEGITFIGNEKEFQIKTLSVTTYLYEISNINPETRYKLYLKNLSDPQFPKKIFISCYNKNLDPQKLYPLNSLSLIINIPKQNEIIYDQLKDTSVNLNITDYTNYENKEFSVYSLKYITNNEGIKNEPDIIGVNPGYIPYNLIYNNTNKQIQITLSAGTGFKDIKYTLDFDVYDNDYLVSQIKLNLIELAPIEINSNISYNIVNLTNNLLECNLENLFIINDENSTNNFRITLLSSESTLVNGVYNLLQPYELVDNILKINPEYRNTNYVLEVELYKTNYPSYILNREIHIHEKQIPDIILDNQSITTYYLSNLSIDIIESNLNSYFTNYPYTSELKFSSNISNTNTNVQIINNILRITSDLRGISYNIDIIAKDEKFSNDINNKLRFVVIELEPIVINTTVLNSIRNNYINLGNEKIIYNLQNLFIKNYNNLDLIIDVISEKEYMLFSSNVSNIYYENNILEINSEFRNHSYIVTINGYLQNYENQNKTILLTIDEDEVTPLDFDGVGLVYSEQTNETININIHEYFATYPYLYLTTIDLIFTPENVLENRKPYNYQLNDGILTINPELRDMSYTIKVIIEDIYFNQYDSNLTITIEEKSPLERTNTSIPSYNNLNNHEIIYDLDQLFIANITENIKYDIYYVENNYICNIPIGLHNGNKPAIELIDRNHLKIVSEFRDKEYDARISAYLHDYSNQKIDIDINIDEMELTPLSEVIGLRTVWSNLKYTDISVNLHDYFYSHPLTNRIEFSTHITYQSKNTFDRTNYGIRIEDSSNLIISPNLNDYYYDITVHAYVSGYNLLNSNVVFRIHEQSYWNDKRFNNKYIFEDLTPNNFDLSEFYIDDYSIFTVEFYGDEPRHSFHIDETFAFEITNGSNLTIYPEFRNDSYQIQIVSRRTFDDPEPNSYILNIQECNISPIEYISSIHVFSNLSNQSILYDVSGYYSYPFVNDFIYTYTLLDGIGNVNITNQSIININPDCRDTYYNIKITVTDDKFNITNDSLIINVHELAPIYNKAYFEVLSNLTNIEIESNLNQYFNFVAPELSRNYSYNIYGYKDNNPITVPSGNYNSGDIVQLNGSILTIFPEYRKQFIDYYEIDISVYIGLYTNQSNFYKFRIYEENIPDIIEDETFKSIENLSNVLYVFSDLNEIYSTYPYKDYLVLTSNIYQTINPDIEFMNKNFNDFTIDIENHNVNIYPNVRGITYFIRLTVIDTYFNLSNSNLILSVNEKYPIYVGESINDEGNISNKILGLSNLIVDLDGNFIKSIPEYDIIYRILYIVNPRPANYLPKELETIPDGAIYEPYTLYGGKKYNDYRSNAVYVENGSNLIVSPEFRNDTYYVTVEAILKDPNNIYTYITQSNIQTFQFTEYDIPSLYMEEPYTSLSNYKLTNKDVVYDLWKFYTNYPFYLDLNYSITLFSCNNSINGSNIYDIEIQDNPIYNNNIITSKYYVIDQENHTLTLKPKFRDNYYALFINAFDPYKTSNSNNDLRIEVSEESLGDGIPEQIYLGSREIIFNLHDYVIDPETTFVIESTPHVDDLSNAYYNNEKAWRFENGSNLIFQPEYRNIIYEIEVTYYDGFGDIIRSNISQINEIEVRDIKANPPIIISDLKTTELVYDLDDLYNYTDIDYFASKQPDNEYYINYPFKTKLEFEVIGDYYYFDNNNTITLQPDVRGIDYNITIISRDSNFNLYSSNVLFNLTELFPIDRIQNYNNITENGYEYNINEWYEKITEINLKDYYQINHETIENYNYNIYSNEVLIYENNNEVSFVDNGIYSHNKQIQLINSNLYIIGDYRNYSYNIRVDSYLDGYSNSHTINHITDNFTVTEENIPKIELLDNTSNFYLYNQILSYNLFNNSNLYNSEIYPFWQYVKYQTDFTGDDILDRVTLNSNNGLLSLNTKLEERSKEYQIRIIVGDENERFQNSINNDIIYHIHELGKIINIDTLPTINMNNYGNHIINITNIYNIFQYDNFIGNNKLYNEIIDFKFDYSNLGSRLLDIKYINTDTLYSDIKKPSIDILIDVRGISYNVVLDLSYIGYYNETSNLNISFQVNEKEPLEYIDTFQLRKYIGDDSLLESEGIFKQIPESSSNIIDMDSDIYINNNPNCNIIHQIYSAYVVNPFTNYPEYISKNLIYYTEFIGDPRKFNILTNNYGIDGRIINNLYIESLDPSLRYVYPNNSIANAFLWNNDSNVTSSTDYSHIKIDGLLKENDNITITYWYKNFESGINCNILFELDNIISIYTENSYMNVNVYDKSFSNMINNNDWNFYINSIKYTDTEIEYKFYINTELINIQKDTLPILSTNNKDVYIGPYIQDKIALADFKIYNNDIEDDVISNLYYGVRHDYNFTDATLRITRPETQAYNLTSNILTIETDLSGLTYDLTIKSYLEGYDEYQELFYTFRIKENEFQHNFKDGGTIENVDMVFTIENADFENEYLPGTEEYEEAILLEIASILGLDPIYLEILDVIEGSIKIYLRIKPYVFDTISPIGYAFLLQNKLLNLETIHDSNVKIKGESQSNIINDIIIQTPIRLEFHKDYEIQYEPFNIDINSTFKYIENITYQIYKDSQYNNISLINNSNIYIIPQARGERYDITIFGEKQDQDYEVRIYLKITELLPAEVILDKNVDNIINYVVLFKEVDLKTFYPDYHRHDLLQFDIISEYSNLLNVTQDGILQVTGTILAKDYNIEVTTYNSLIPKYDGYVNSNLILNVKEVIPIELLSVNNINIEDLVLDKIECNLTSYFNYASSNYPSSILKYTYNTNSNSDIVINSENIIFQADVRDDRYIVNINAYYVDHNSNILYYTSNNDFSFTIHEKAPLEFNQTIFSIEDLTNIQEIVDLTSKITINNIPQFNLGYTSNFPILRDGYYNDKVALELNESNLIIYPEYRGQSYIVETEVYVDGYYGQAVTLTFNIEECNIPEIIFINNINLIKSNLIQEITEYDLRTYFEYPYVDKLIFSSNIITSLKPGSHDYQVNINDLSNLKIEADLRDMLYEIEIKAYDENFNKSNEEMKIEIDEKAPLEFNQTIFFIEDLTNIQHIVDLTSKITVNNIPQFNLRYTSNFPILRDGYYNDKVALELNESNLIIYPEYRGQSYIVETEVYVEGYYEQAVTLTFNIEECNIPEIIFIDNINLIKSNLIKEITEYDLRTYFEYPYVDKLIFSSNIITSLKPGSHDYQVNINDLSNLKIEADLRDMLYEIEIKAYDENFNKSNEEMKIEIDEKAPIYYKYDSNNLEFYDQEGTPVNITLTDYFIKTIGNSYDYTFEINCNLRKTLGGNKDVVEIIDDILTINVDYRNEEYIITVNTFLVDYETQGKDFIIIVEECNVVPFESLRPNIESIHLTTGEYIVDLREKFSIYQFINFVDFYYSVEEEPTNGRKPLNISIIDTSNLLIDGDLRDMNYRVNILGIHESYDSSNINFYIDVNEDPPVSIIYNINNTANEYVKRIYLEKESGWLQIDGIDWIEECNVWSYNELFINNAPECNLSISFSTTLGDITGIHKIKNAYEVIDENLYIHQDFRGKEYTVLMTFTMEGYESQKLYLQFYVDEYNLPTLTSYPIEEKKFKDMITIEEIINLNERYNWNEYPFMKDLEFTCNITINYNNVIIDGSNLIVNPNLRGDKYSINIIAQDTKLPSVINTDINIDVIELPELNIINCNIINIYSSHIENIEKNILEKYLVSSCNHYNELINLISFEIITNEYNNIELTNDCNLIISTDLRGQNYNINIKAYYKEETNISNNELIYIIDEEYPVKYIGDKGFIYEYNIIDRIPTEKVLDIGINKYDFTTELKSQASIGLSYSNIIEDNDIIISDGTNIVNINNYNITIPKGYQIWHVKQTNNYNLIAGGARGGWYIFNGDESDNIDGKGIVVSTTVNLIKDDYVIIVIGKQGIGLEFNKSAGGGGGTFISKLNGINNNFNDINNHTLLLVAGGGGGMGYRPESESQSIIDFGKNAVVTTHGTTAPHYNTDDYASDGGGGGGGGGEGGNIESGFNGKNIDDNDKLGSSGGGGGYIGNGGYTFGQPTNTALSYLNGFSSNLTFGYGGFGGGGSSFNSGGGGGGYSGGNAASSHDKRGGGSGGSYDINGINNNATQYITWNLNTPKLSQYEDGGYCKGDGFLVIDFNLNINEIIIDSNIKNYNLENNIININLRNKYEILLPNTYESNLLFNFTIDKELRLGYYNGEKEAVEIIDNSNLIINPEYRGLEYIINIGVYIDIEPYNQRLNSYNFINVKESNIAELTYIESKSYNFNNLYNEIYIIDLSEYVSEYPFHEYINYKVLTIENSNAYIEQNSNLIFLAGEQNSNYNIDIEIKDNYFEGNNDIATFTFYTTSVDLGGDDEPIVW
jgi:hypothetical protein